MDKPEIEIVIDRIARIFRVHDGLAEDEPVEEPLPEGEMPWRFTVDVDPQEASRIVVSAAGSREQAAAPERATACSAIAVEAWIGDKVFETHDDTLYWVRVINTSEHYVAEDLCVDVEIDPSCAAVLGTLSDKHRLIEIVPPFQGVRCLVPGHYVDLQFVAIARGPRPGVFPVRVCVAYDLVYSTRARAATQVRLELEVQDDCGRGRNRCRPGRVGPPDPGEWKPAPRPPPGETVSPPVQLVAEVPVRVPGPERVEEPEAPPRAVEPEEQPGRHDEDRESQAWPDDDEDTEGSDEMSNSNYGKHEHVNWTRKGEEEAPADKKGAAPQPSNHEELEPIATEVKLPEGGTLKIEFTFRKGFIASSNRGGRCVYGKRPNGNLECRLESIDDTVLVMEVTNCSRFHLKHVRIHDLQIYHDGCQVNALLPSGHPIAQIVPDSAYIGMLPRDKTRWVAMSLITRGVEPGEYSIKFAIDYDIEACSVGASIDLQITCD
ncbi:hypothetical protein [Nannocystis punicea]|uniref:Uncharacterized protein n=1 Tax=Nannocystis punicea TaxID=2995304 RepID=A0ABY7H755_9BACT|nr:hypothetical protein [Nannocystis poenicansa]WAS94839.1 hypothetical protein O0S08_01650 [Nannocystis poenicansa]